MGEGTTAADDDRILGYARLIDPGVWSRPGAPEATAARLRHSIESPADGMDGEEAAGLVAILMGGGGSFGEAPDRDPHNGPAATGRTHPEAEDDAEGDGPDEGSVPHPEPDPDHDPEAGISHVGDADAGQHHEED